MYIASNLDSYRKMVGEPYLHASAKTEKKAHKKHGKKELNVSTDKKTNWKIKIFCPYINERDGFL